MNSTKANTNNNMFTFTNLPQEKMMSTVVVEENAAEIRCFDGDNDSLSMHLSDVDSIFSISGDQFFNDDDDQDALVDKNSSCEFQQNQQYQFHQEQPQSSNNNYKQQEPIYNQQHFQQQQQQYQQQPYNNNAPFQQYQQCRQIPEMSFDDFEPIMFSTLQTAISRIPDVDFTAHPPMVMMKNRKNKKSSTNNKTRPQKKNNNTKRKNNYKTTKSSSQNNKTSQAANSSNNTPENETMPQFLPPSSPHSTRFNTLQTAVNQSKKSHEDLLDWDKSQGVKKGFSRTMSKTNSSRVLVQSIIDDRKRMVFGTTNGGGLSLGISPYQYQQHQGCMNMGNTMGF